MYNIESGFLWYPSFCSYGPLLLCYFEIMIQRQIYKYKNSDIYSGPLLAQILKNTEFREGFI